MLANGNLGFQSKGGDPDMWIYPITRADRSLVCKYILLYTDNSLVISGNTEAILRKKLGRYFELKNELIDPSSILLGRHLTKGKIDGSTKACAFSSN